MRDVLFFLVILTFFTLAVLFVRGCEWISRERE
jgi:hypothetical protein